MTGVVRSKCKDVPIGGVYDIRGARRAGPKPLIKKKTSKKEVLDLFAMPM